MWPAQQDLHQEQRTTGWLQMDLPNEPILTSGESHLLPPLFSHLIYLERCFHFPTFAFVSKRIAEAIGFPNRWAPYCSKLRFQFAAVPQHSRSLLTLSFMADGRDNWKHNGFRQMALTHRPTSSFLMRRELTVYLCDAAFSKNHCLNAITQVAERKTAPSPNHTVLVRRWI